MKKNNVHRLLPPLLFMLFADFCVAPAQDKKLDFSGHLQNLNTVWIQETSSAWYTTGSIYNRLNLKGYIHDNWTISASARNVMNFGQLVYLNYPFYSDLLVEDQGALDMTWTLASDSSYILYSNIDRANLRLNKGKLEVIAGRQRINWGINMVWNPNDIFNTFNYYDFDYVERPGCDAIRTIVHFGHAGGIEGALKIDSEDKITAAGMWKFNRWNYDFQVLGGVMTTDFVAGAGWSGYIKNAGFTGEASWFKDRNNFNYTTGIWVVSAGGNYTFKNSLYTQASVLYTSNGTTGNAGWGNTIIVLQQMTPKNFTNARWSIMGQLSYPFTPLIQGDVSAIFNPFDGSFFLGPNVNFSLTDNITLLLMGQVFVGENGTEFGDYGQLYYTRLKWSF